MWSLTHERAAHQPAGVEGTVYWGRGSWQAVYSHGRPEVMSRLTPTALIGQCGRPASCWLLLVSRGWPTFHTDRASGEPRP